MAGVAARFPEVDDGVLAVLGLAKFGSVVRDFVEIDVEVAGGGCEVRANVCGPVGSGEWSMQMVEIG